MDDADTSSSEPPSDEPDRARPSAPAPGGPVFDLVDPGCLLTEAQRRFVCRHAAEALGHLASGGEVRARVVDDARMAEAHARYAGVEGTTDVLTFDLSGGDGLDADLLICLDEARRQGERRGHAPEQELLLYIVHGVLHCLGHDDHTEPDAARMHAEEDRVLSLIGVGATFARGGEEPA
jgi:probable rRNA maturation factor